LMFIRACKLIINSFRNYYFSIFYNTYPTRNVSSLFITCGPCSYLIVTNSLRGIGFPCAVGTYIFLMSSGLERNSRGYRTLIPYRSLPSTVCVSIIPPKATSNTCCTFSIEIPYNAKIRFTYNSICKNSFFFNTFNLF